MKQTLVLGTLALALCLSFSTLLGLDESSAYVAQKVKVGHSPEQGDDPGHGHNDEHDHGQEHDDEHDRGSDHGHGHGDGHDHGNDHGHGHSDAHDDATVHHRFEDAEAWAARFEDPERDEWQLPGQIVEALVDRDDLVIADIGSATGYFPVRFALAVPRGAVIGSDIEPDMVRYLNDRARKEGLSNLTSVLASDSDPHLPRRADVIFICNTYHHISDRVEYLQNLKAQLAPDARIAIVDFRLDSPRGPNHKLDPQRVREEFQAAGYEPYAEHDFLPDQYFHVYRVSTR